MTNIQRSVSYYAGLSPQTFLNEILIKKNIPNQDLINILKEMKTIDF